MPYQNPNIDTDSAVKICQRLIKLRAKHSIDFNEAMRLTVQSIRVIQTPETKHEAEHERLELISLSLRHDKAAEITAKKIMRYGQRYPQLAVPGLASYPTPLVMVK